MTLRLPDRWIWDSWYTWHDGLCHAFYLSASKGLVDPNRRHRYTSVGHAVSEDLTNWEVLPDALAPNDSPAFDSWTTWTGSVVQVGERHWRMFYTGTSREDKGAVQRILAADSTDLISWHKVPGLVVEASPGHYEVLQDGTWPDECWRDPWVYYSDEAKRWEMLVTARAVGTRGQLGGVVGFATSENLEDWEVLQPLTEPVNDFGHLEVLQFEIVDGTPILLFCCDADKLSPERRQAFGNIDATYSVACPNGISGADISQAKPFDTELVYAGRLVKGKEDRWNLLGFHNYIDGKFVGQICDPIPVTATPEEGLVIDANRQIL